jgi:hypothetical protein
LQRTKKEERRERGERWLQLVPERIRRGAHVRGVGAVVEGKDHAEEGAHASLVLFLSGRRHEEKLAKGYGHRNMGSVGSGRGRKRPPVGLGCRKERMTWVRIERRAQGERVGFPFYKPFEKEFNSVLNLRQR